MSEAAIPINDNDEAEEAASQRVFVRMINARPGPPWDQSRQATLDARLGAPAPLSEVVYRLRRIDPWRPGSSARFAAIYARTQDARAGLVVTPTIDGRRISVSFTPPAQHARQARSLLIALVASGAATALVVTAVGVATARRGEATSALESFERIAAARVKQSAELGRMKRQTVLLDAAGLSGRRLDDVLSDLAWASRSKAAGAHIQALHWDHGFMAVEVGGDVAPFEATDRTVERAKAQVRPGVWLWGVGSLDPWSSGPAPRRAPKEPVR